jgi:hypothetical protein
MSDVLRCGAGTEPGCDELAVASLDVDGGRGAVEVVALGAVLEDLCADRDTEPEPADLVGERPAEGLER